MATTTVKTIRADDLERKLRDDVGVHVWNVLTDQWFKNELIPGSRHVPLDKIDQAVAQAHIAKDAPVVVYCAGPTFAACSQSREAAEKLSALGFSRVEAFEGGLTEWKKAGHGTVSTGDEKR